MQRGIIRSRSPSPGAAVSDRPTRRQRLATHSVHETVSTPHPTPDTMGLPLHAHHGPSTSNGHSISTASNGHSDPGPSHRPYRPNTVSPDVLAMIKPVHSSGSLMYEDDADWADYQGPDGDVTMEGDDPPTRERRAPMRRIVAEAKRMPVDRKEGVRLILQGLRDLGYQCVSQIRPG